MLPSGVARILWLYVAGPLTSGGLEVSVGVAIATRSLPGVGRCGPRATVRRWPDLMETADAAAMDVALHIAARLRHARCGIVRHPADAKSAARRRCSRDRMPRVGIRVT